LALAYTLFGMIPLFFIYLLHFCPNIHNWIEIYEAMVVNRAHFLELNSQLLGKNWWFAPRRTLTKLWNCAEHEVKFERTVLKQYWKASNQDRARAVVISTAFDVIIFG